MSRYFCLLIVLSGLCLSVIAADRTSGKNLLPLAKMKWTLGLHNGGKGSLKTLPNGQKVLTRLNTGGVVMLANRGIADIPIKPGKSYFVSATFRTSKEDVKARLMISMGGKRRPYPVSGTRSGVKKDTKINVIFKAAPDEKTLRIHIVYDGGQGTITMKSISVKELAPIGSGKISFSHKSLLRYWKAFGMSKDKSTSKTIRGDFSVFGGIACTLLNYKAAQVAAIELDINSGKDGALITLEFTGKYKGKKISGNVSRMIVPSSKRQTVIFYPQQSPTWRGKINSIKFKVKSIIGTQLSFYAIRVLPTANLIPNAIKLGKKGGSRDIKLMRPNAEYQINWKGEVNPGAKITLINTDYQDIKTITFTKDSKSPLRFKTNLTTMAGKIKVPKGGKGYPVLKNISLPLSQKLPAEWWKATWIWVTSGAKPDGDVWFYKEFYLADKPESGEMVFTADDEAEIFVNGKSFKGNRNWRLATMIDISKSLRSGKNIIKAKVSDWGAAGGLLLEIYTELANGKSQRIITDKTWKCSIGSKEAKRWITPASEVGTSWSNRMNYIYVGPKVKAQVKKISNKSFAIQLDKASPIKTGSIMLKITSDAGDSLLFDCKVQPPTSEWKINSETIVNYVFSEENATILRGKKITVNLDIDFLKFDSEPIIYSFDKKVNKQTEFPQASVEGAGKRPWIIVDGKRLAPYYYDLPTTFIRLPIQKAVFLENSKKAGCDIVRLPLNIVDFHPSSNTYDFSKLDFALSVVKSRIPNMKVILTLATFMPEWWLKANPGHAVKFYQKTKRAKNDDFQSLASSLWLKMAQKEIVELIKHLKNSSYASMIIGIVPADGQTWEWLWSHGRGHGGRRHSGFSPAAIDSYRIFLRDKYKNNIENLRQAWNCGNVEFDKILPPLPNRLDASSIGILLDPNKERDIMDFHEFRNEIIAHDIMTLCKTIKEESNNRLLTGSYYGYTIMFGRLFFIFQSSGHLRLNKVAKSKLVDLWYAPTLYNWRAPGYAVSHMQPVGAITAHGGLPIAEFDIRTYTEPSDAQHWNGKVDTVETTFGVMERAFGLAITRGTGAHWMEMHERWFCEPILLNLIHKQIDFYRSLPAKTQGTTPLEVCMVIDEESPMYVKTNLEDGIHRAVISQVSRIMPNTGVAYRQIMLNDFLTPGLIPPHKFYIFANLFTLSDIQRKVLKKRLSDEKAASLWMYAPGVFRPGQAPSKAGILDMINIDTKMLMDAKSWTLMSTAKFGGEKVNSSLATSPYFMPKKGFDVVIGKSLSGTPLVVGKKQETGKMLWFSAFPNPPAKMIREMARKAGARIWVNSDEPTYVGNDFVFLHARVAGKKQLQIPDGYQARQVAGPKILINKQTWEWTAIAGRTYGFIIKKAQ